MQYVNNDMDDLFRRAAEDYPLHTEGADWNKVMQKMESGRKAVQSNERKMDRSFLWIAAVVLFVICTTYIQKGEHIVQQDATAILNKPVSRPGDKATKGNVEVPAGQPDSSAAIVINIENGLVHKKRPNLAFTSQEEATDPFLIPAYENPSEKGMVAKDQAPENRLVSAELEKENTSSGKGQLSSITNEPLIVLNKEVDANEQSASPKGQLAGKILEGLSKKLYAGLAIGPDVSSVKSQGVNDAGYSLGVIAGFKFNKRLSLETGVLWDRKEYYSSGRHFNIAVLGLPQHANITDVDGYCNMFEIPINLKFNWAQKKGYNFFASTGVSSYLMKKEAYDYAYEYYGAQYDYYKQYKNASRNWASIVNLSIGYEKKVGNAGYLRIEPYMKLPLRGVGIGKMPIDSKGVLVGFTRPIR